VGNPASRDFYNRKELEMALVLEATPRLVDEDDRSHQIFFDDGCLMVRHDLIDTEDHELAVAESDEVETLFRFMADHLGYRIDTMSKRVGKATKKGA